MKSCGGRVSGLEGSEGSEGFEGSEDCEGCEGSEGSEGGATLTLGGRYDTPTEKKRLQKFPDVAYQVKTFEVWVAEVFTRRRMWGVHQEHPIPKLDPYAAHYEERGKV